MKKLTFKGVINGKEFDNIVDYNEELVRIISQGESIVSATSSTQFIDNDEQPKNIEPTNTCVCNHTCKAAEPKDEVRPQFNPHNYLLFFNDPMNGYYLDKLVSENDDVNDRNLSITEKTFNQNLENFEKDLVNNNLPLWSAFDLITDLKEIRSKISEDAESTASSAADIQEKIKEEEQKLHLLKNAEPFIDLFSNYYNKLFDLVKGYMLKF